VGTMLAQAGYEVLTAADGRQAMALVEEREPSYLIADWSMPHIDGLELCRRVRAAGLPNYTYIMLLTARSNTDDLAAGFHAGADEFVCKSVLQAELLPRMKSGQRIVHQEQRLLKLAKTDPLTGLPTRRAFYEQLERELGRARRFKLPLSCVMLDIDFFKKVNDTLGHGVGDKVLMSLAESLRGCVRVSDMVGRHGGEEFCILLPETNEFAAGIWAERTRTAIAKMVMEIGGHSLGITVSMGVAERMDDTTAPEALIELADQALLVAKQCGRNRVVRYGELHGSTTLGLDDLHDARHVMRKLTAKDVMSGMISCLREDEPVQRATEFFLRCRINSAPVVNAEGKLAGILSEKDVLSLLTSPDTWQRPIHEAMKTHVVCYEESTPVESIYDFLCRVTIRRVIVVRDGFPVGSISRGTLLRWYATWLESHKGRDESPVSTDESRQAQWRQCLSHTAQDLVKSADYLQCQLHAAPPADDVLPMLVRSVSEMQELVSTLLFESRRDQPVM
ncbi:MAG: diguanylate cyclase, partial [Pirellulales bacterium]